MSRESIFFNCLHDNKPYGFSSFKPRYLVRASLLNHIASDSLYTLPQLPANAFAIGIKPSTEFPLFNCPALRTYPLLNALDNFILLFEIKKFKHSNIDV